MKNKLTLAASLILSTLFFQPVWAMDMSDPQVRRELQLKAEQGDAYAQAMWGKALMLGEGVKMDPKKGWTWIKASVDQNHPMGNFWACRGFHMLQAKDKALPYCQKSLAGIKQLATGEDTEAMAALGYLYLEGLAVAKNEKEAMRWYEKAMGKQSIAAHMDMARIYRDGLGVEKNNTIVFTQYDIASKLGSSDAQYQLAVLYYDGMGVEQDLDVAEALVDQALKAQSMKASLFSLKAAILRKRKEFDEAILLLTKAINMEPGSSHYWRLRGELYSEVKMPQKAVYDFTQAIQLSPQASDLMKSNLYRMRGAAHAQANKMQASIADFTKAINFDPKGEYTPLIFVIRGISHYYNNQFEKAVYDLKTGLNSDKIPEGIKSDAESLLKLAQRGAYTPAQVVAQFYNQHQFGGFNVEGEEIYDYEELRNFFTLSLLKKLAYMVIEYRKIGGPGYMEADFFIGAQWPMKSHHILSTQIQGNTAYVKVKIQYAHLPGAVGRSEILNLKLRFQRGWFIDDIIYSGGGNLKSWE